MRHLANPTRNFSPADKVGFYVADTDDVEYQDRRKYDWQMRIYAQMLKDSYEDYNIYFFTLTYSDRFLPKFEVTIPKSYDYVHKQTVDKVCTFDVFSRQDINRFITNLRQDLYRTFGITDMHYIICSEYGENTQRSHYHCMFAVPKSGFINGGETKTFVGPFTFHQLVNKHWSVVVSKTRVPGKRGEDAFKVVRSQLGFVLPKFFDGRFVNGRNQKPILVEKNNIVNASKYVSKYCTKDLSFYNKKDLKKAMDYLKKHDEKQYHELKKHVPFIKVSQHFGECLVDVVCADSMPNWASGISRHDNQIDDCVDGIITPLCPKRYCPLPSYILRKLFVKRELHHKEVFYPPLGLVDFREDIFTDREDWAVYHGKRKVFKYYFTESKTDLYKACLPRLFDKAVNAQYDRLIDFVRTKRGSQHFRDWYEKNWSLGELDFDSLDEGECHKLAVYKVAYQDRVNPAHYQKYMLDPTICERKYTIFQREETVTIEEYNPRDGRYYKRSVNELQEDVLDVYDDLMNTPIDDDVLIENAIYNHGDVTFPYFNGTEDGSYMVSHAMDMYQCLGDVVRTPTDEKSAPYESFSLLFNSFPCFRGYDDLLLCINSYYKDVNNEERLAKLSEEKEQKSIKDEFFGYC